MSRSFFTPTLTFAALLAVTLPAAPGARAGDFLFQWDNDKVVDTDRHYTNGMRIAATYDQPPGSALDQAGGLLERYSLFPGEDKLRIGWVFGQDMFTPEDVGASVPDPRDRPYAGWTYAGASVQREDGNRLDTLEFDLGVIGPAAKAGETQNWFHRQINVAPSRGWAHQINNEPGLLATRMLKLRTAAVDVPGAQALGLDWLKGDAIGHATAHLGNVRTGAAAGATLRLGENLDQDFGPIYGTFALPQKRPGKLTWALFAGAEARAVGRDVFLDGNTFQESPDVKKNYWVGEARFGASVHVPFDERAWIEGVRLNLNLVQRTREFRSQDKPDRYGSFQLTVNY